jgi:hypothetical protein
VGSSYWATQNVKMSPLFRLSSVLVKETRHSIIVRSRNAKVIPDLLGIAKVPRCWALLG